LFKYIRLTYFKLKIAAGGTLSTYTWVNIVINFLQMRNPPILPVLHQIPCAPTHTHGVNVAFFDDVSLLAGFGRANKETLGGLLFAFFKHFGYEYDFNENVVSVRHGKYLSKKEKGWHTGKLYRMFCIEEPFTTIRNLGNSADLISVIGIRDELRRAARILLEKSSFSMVCQTYRPIYSNSDGSETEDPNTGETSFFQWDDEIVEELTYLTSQLALDHPHYLHPPKYDPKRRINLPKSAPLPNIPNLYSNIPEPKPAATLATKLKDPSPRSNNRSKSDQRTNHDTSGPKPKGEPNGKENGRRSNSSNSRNRSRGRGEKSGNRGSKNNSNSNANSSGNPPNNSSSQSSKSSKSRKKSNNRNSSRANGKANQTATATAS
jgi:DNA polymerase sigma